MVLSMSSIVQSRLQVPADALTAFCQKWRVTELALFGSILSSDFRPDSDVDVLVTFSAEAKWSLFDLYRMQTDLSLLLGRTADIHETGTIRNPFRKRGILSSKEVIYAS